MLRNYYLPALLFKLGCGIVMGLLFQSYYEGGDTFKFYQEASVLTRLKFPAFIQAITHEVSWSDPMRAIYFVRMIALVKYITQADYWLLSAYFSLFSFLGCFYFSDKLVEWNNEFKFPVILGFLYFPSVVFWSSGLLKESLAFAALTFTLGSYVRWRQLGRLSIGNILIGGVSLIFLVSIKYYIAAVLLPLLLFLTIYHLPFWKQLDGIRTWKRSALIVAVMILPTLLFFNWLNPNLTYQRFWHILIESHETFLSLSPDGGLFLLSWFDNWMDTLVNIPYLWFSGIYRPLFGENLNFPTIFSEIENLILLIGSIAAVVYFAKNKMFFNAEILAILIYVSSLSIFLSFSAPNFGTLARFKVYYAPFVLMFVVYQLQSLHVFRKN